MEFIQNLFNPIVIETIGWTLFHSLWQATLICLLMIGILKIFKNHSAKTRYLITILSLGAVIIWSAISFGNSYRYASQKAETLERVQQNPELVKEILKENLSVNAIKPLTTSEKLNLKKIRFRGFMQRNFHFIFFFWLIGVLVFLLRLTGAILHLHNLRNRLVAPVEENIEKLLGSIKSKLNLSKKVIVLQSGLAKVPMVIGHLKPYILLPVSLLSGLSQKEIEAVIAHELAHIKRHDYFINILQSIIETLFFFHPAVWIISNTIRNERENCCDELAVEATNDKVNYLKALTRTYEISETEPTTYQLAFTAKKTSLLERVVKIKNIETMKKNVTEGFIAASIVFLGLILVSFSFDGQNLKKDEAPDMNETAIETPSVKMSGFSITKMDSINKQISESMDEVPDEVTQLIEAAYSDADTELAESIRQSIEEVRAEVNMEEIMLEVQTALEEANINEEIRMGMEEARLEILQEGGDSMEIALEALEMASAAIEAIDIEDIVSVAMESVTMAMEDIDLGTIISESMEAAFKALEEIDFEELELTEEEIKELKEAKIEMAKEREKEAKERFKEAERMREEARERQKEPEKRSEAARERVSESARKNSNELEQDRLEEMEKTLKDLEK
jgi:bla regulator protein BlaR1